MGFCGSALPNSPQECWGKWWTITLMSRRGHLFPLGRSSAGSKGSRRLRNFSVSPTENLQELTRLWARISRSFRAIPTGKGGCTGYAGRFPRALLTHTVIANCWMQQLTDCGTLNAPHRPRSWGITGFRVQTAQGYRRGLRWAIRPRGEDQKSTRARLPTQHHPTGGNRCSA